MEQPKISVFIDGEVDVTALDEEFFITLLNNITKMHCIKQSTQNYKAKNN